MFVLEIVQGPLKESETKLPVSMQVTGKERGEGHINRAAYAWEMTIIQKKM